MFDSTCPGQLTWFPVPGMISQVKSCCYHWHTCANTVPVGLSCDAGHCCAHRCHVWVGLQPASLLWKLAWRLSVSRKLVFRNEPFRSVPLKFPGLFLKCMAPLALGLIFHLQRRETNKGSSNRYLRISWTALTSSSQEGFSYPLLGFC